MASRWNKLPRTLWTDGVMATLDPVPLTEATLYLYMMTCDRPTRIAGLLRGPVSIAEDTGWDLKGVRKGVRMLHAKGHLMVSERPFYILVPAALAFDLPGPGKETKGALTTLAELPQVGPVVAAASIIQAREWVWPEKGDAMPLPMGHAEGHRKPESREQGAGSSTQGSILVPAEPERVDEPLRVWGLWRERNPSARKAPTAKQRATIKARLAEYSVEDLGTYYRWVRESGHKRAVYCRENAHDGWESVMRTGHVDERVPWALAWESSGAVKAPAGQVPGLTDEQRIAAQRKYAWQRDELVARMEAAPDIAAIPEITLPRLDSLLGTLVRAEPVPEWLRVKWVIGMDRRRVELQERRR